MPTKPQPPSLLDLVGQDHAEHSLLAALLAEAATAQLLVAWRQSVRNLEAARATAVAAGDGDLVRWVDGAVRVERDGNA